MIRSKTLEMVREVLPEHIYKEMVKEISPERIYLKSILYVRKVANAAKISKRK